MHSFLIADDHIITRIGIITTLNSLFGECEIEEAENGKEVFEKLTQRNFDMLITDLGMPYTDIFKLVEMSLIIRPALRILILSVNKEELFATNYLKSGALGYLEKTGTHQELINAIQTVQKGEIYASPSLTKLFFSSSSGKKANPFSTLSQRELDICRMLCDGVSITQIAVILQLATSTIGTHKYKILHKVGAANLVDLIKLAHGNSMLNE